MAQFISNDDTIRIVVDKGYVYIRVLSDSHALGSRKSLDKLKVFINDLQSEDVHISEIMKRKVFGVVGETEPDCVVLKLT